MQLRIIKIIQVRSFKKALLQENLNQYGYSGGLDQYIPCALEH